MQSIVNKLSKYILSGELIIVPTDTVYGLVCRYDSRKAVDKIYKLKKRDRKKPLILLGYNWNALKRFVKLTRQQVRVIHELPLQKLWPGPLTLVLPASKHVPVYLNKRFKTIGIRVPKNRFLLSLLKHCPEKVLASTSANISGKKDVKEIAQKVKLFVMAKKGEMSGKPSKIVEIIDSKTKILR